MNLKRENKTVIDRGVPHVRGDEPDDDRNERSGEEAFPMYVGMNRYDRVSDNRFYGVPHVRGDEPWL